MAQTSVGSRTVSSREVLGRARDETDPRDLEGPVVPWSWDFPAPFFPISRKFALLISLLFFALLLLVCNNYKKKKIGKKNAIMCIALIDYHFILPVPFARSDQFISID